MIVPFEIVGAIVSVVVPVSTINYFVTKMVVSNQVTSLKLQIREDMDGAIERLDDKYVRRDVCDERHE